PPRPGGSGRRGPECTFLLRWCHRCRDSSDFRERFHAHSRRGRPVEPRARSLRGAEHTTVRAVRRRYRERGGDVTYFRHAVPDARPGKRSARHRGQDRLSRHRFHAHPVQTGSRNEVEPGKSGFAHFFEHMMFRGTEQYPPDVYGAILKQAGANQNAYTTDDYTNYHVTFTRDDLEKMIELEADRFQNLSYSEADFRTEALAVKGEYLKNYSDPTSKAYERIRDLAFDVHTYRHTTMGFIEDIEDMPNQLEYSRQFFERWYRPEKTSVIIVGDVDPEATFELVKKYWGGWERGDYDVEIPVEPPLEGPVYEHIAWEGPTQPWIFIAFRGPAFDPNEKAMPAMDLIA